MKNTRQIVALLTVVGILLGTQAGVFAATSTIAPSGINGYQVSPVRTDLTINPGQTQDITVYIQNVSSAVEQLQTVVNDFQAKDETGTPSLLLNGQAAPQHGLKKYVSLASSNFTLQPKEQKGVVVHITIPKGAPGGGYFGAVRFQPASTSGTSNVNLAASVTSLILIRVSGNVTDQLNIASFDVQKKPADATQTPSASTFFTSGKNLQVAVRFQNQGNVQEEPFGKIILKKGKTVLDQQEINNTEIRSSVLPNSIRRFTVDLHNTTAYGKYTLEANFGYGTNGQLLGAKTTFYVVPVTLIVVVLVILVALAFLIFALPRIRRNYRIVRSKSSNR
jgi:uncharacterized protein YxeA